MTRKELANAIRALSMDAVQKANSWPPWSTNGDGRYRRSAVELFPAP
ncbi:transketolase [Citrobacter freundii]|nr:transketolase [Citrobacter freundii]